MLHWTHCYITRVLHQRPLIHWANLTLALRSQSTQREQFICAFVSGPSQTRSSLHSEIYIHVAADSITLLRENRFLKDHSPLLLHILTVITKQQPVGWHQHNRAKLFISWRRHLRLTSKQSRHPYVFK